MRRTIPVENQYSINFNEISLFLTLEPLVKPYESELMSEYEYESTESFGNSSDERMDEGSVKHKGGTVSIKPA
jgi:hypothetical protein